MNSSAGRAPMLAALTVAGGAACAISILIPLADASQERTTSAIVHGLIVAVPVALGVLTLARRPGDRFGLLLVMIGSLWSLVALAESDAEVLYSAGRVAGWFADASVVALLLAFPSGRLTTRAEWRVAGAVGLMLALLYLPTALLVDQYPVPSPWSTCLADCPANAFHVTSSQPAIIDDVIRPLRELLTVVLYGAVAAILLGRARRGGPLMRRALTPVILTAALRVAILVAYFLGRRDGSVNGTLEVLGWIYLLSLPAVALSFAAGLVARRLQVASALRRLSRRLGAHATPEELRAGLSDALEDPSLQLAFVVADGWADGDGRRLPAPVADPDRVMTELRADGRVAAVMVHDRALGQDPGLLAAAAAYAVVVLENSRLVTRLQDSLQELSASRSRIVAVADESRRRIERDLHDGAQQRLVGLRIRLSMESERLAAVAPAEALALAQLGDEVERTIDEIRDLAHGIYPSLLSERGLGDALRAAARETPVATSVSVDGVGRYRSEVESTVYFVCMEALQNAVKHGNGATHVSISLRDGADLGFEIRDDGPGFDTASANNGSGLTNLRDRVTAVGGSVTVESAPGVGTLVRGAVPLGAA